MKHSRVILVIGVFLFVLQHVNVAYAQDTFGPICDGVTVTCPPDTPVPTAPPGDTPPTDVPVPPVGEPPRAGHAETLLVVSGLAALFITSGILLHRQAGVQA